MKGANFVSFHKLLDEHYEVLEDNIDKVAERIRIIGHTSPGTLKEFLRLSTIKEENTIPDEPQMMKNLAENHEAICVQLRKAIKICQDGEDEGSADALIKILLFHEKAAWILNSWSSK